MSTNTSSNERDFRKISSEMEQLLDKILSNDEKVQLSIPADLSLKGSYESSALILTDKRIISFDSSHKNGMCEIPLEEIEFSEIERMYGNSIFSINVKGKEEPVELNRFTYKVIDLFEALSQTINADRKGSREGGYGRRKEQSAKKRQRCPKCGRILSNNSLICPVCVDKRKLIIRLLSYVMPHLKLAITALLLSAVTTGASLAPPYLTKVLVDSVLKQGDLQRLGIVVVSLLVIYIVEAVLGGVKGYMLRSLAERIILSLRTEVFAKAQRLSIKYYDKSSTGSVMSRISSDTQQLQTFIMRISQDVLIQFMTLVGIIIIMFGLNWELTLLSFIPVPLVVIGSKMFAGRMRPLYHRIWRRRSRLNSILSDTIPAIRVIKAFTSEDRAISLFNNQGRDLLDEQLNAAKMANVYSPLVSFLVMTGGLVIWGLGGYWVITAPDKLSLGILVAFIAYMGRFYGPVQFFANLNDSMQQAVTAAERVFEIIDTAPEPDYGQGKTIDKIKGSVEFKDVTFYYEKGKKILNNINFSIKPGETVGIVGATGSGKSTIVNLLLRFYDAVEGQILLDGADIKDIDLNFLRTRIGYVLQEAVLFRDTIANNICYGKPDATIEEIISAARTANAHNFICKFPDAYDTNLGERGVGLSGGERQRISIARAVIKDPQILILDEATASVDSETEKLIQEAIDRLIQDRTTIIIAHRLSTLKKADKIIVMEDGCISEMGTHDELMEKQGKFYRLVQMQACFGTDILDKLREVG